MEQNNNERMTHEELQRLYIDMLEQNDLQIKYGLPETIPVSMANHMKQQILELQKMPAKEYITDYAQFDTVPAWDANAQYNIGDTVRHNGVIWRATSNNINNEPDNVPGDWETIE